MNTMYIVCTSMYFADVLVPILPESECLKRGVGLFSGDYGNNRNLAHTDNITD